MRQYLWENRISIILEYHFSGICLFGSTGLFACSSVSDGTLSRLSPAQLTWKAAQPPGVKNDDG